MRIYDNKNLTLEQKVDYNEERINQLNDLIKVVYNTDEKLTPDSLTVDIALTNIPQDTPDGCLNAFLMTQEGLLFEVNNIVNPRVNITFVANLTGPQGKQGIQGIQGIQGPKGDTGETGGFDKKDTDTYTIPSSDLLNITNLADISQYFYDRRKENTTNYLISDLDTTHKSVIDSLGLPQGITNLSSNMRLIVQVISNNYRAFALEFLFETSGDNRVYKGILKSLDNPQSYTSFVKWTGWQLITINQKIVKFKANEPQFFKDIFGKNKHYNVIIKAGSGDFNIIEGQLFKPSNWADPSKLNFGKFDSVSTTFSNVYIDLYVIEGSINHISIGSGFLYIGDSSYSNIKNFPNFLSFNEKTQFMFTKDTEMILTEL